MTFPTEWEVIIHSMVPVSTNQFSLVLAPAFSDSSSDFKRLTFRSASRGKIPKNQHIPAMFQGSLRQTCLGEPPSKPIYSYGKSAMKVDQFQWTIVFPSLFGMFDWVNVPASSLAERIWPSNVLFSACRCEILLLDGFRWKIQWFTA